ncbi:hypothetical protein H0H92_003738 [Tricholoma furcatifolium]|nr:hypothetical protein H0H92_003738 [Tricholoma furcatifolium]
MSDHDASPHPPETVHDPGSQQTLDPTPETQCDESGVSAAVNTVIVMARFIRALRDIRISPNKAINYVDEFKQRLRIRHEKSKALERSPSSERLEPQARDEEIQCQRHTDEAAWAVLPAKLAAAKDTTHRDVLPCASPIQLDTVNDPDTSETNSSISQAVLALAPHLGRTSGKSTSSDAHLNKTCGLKLAYGAEKSIDALINRAQLESLQEPILRSLWKHIILDRYVNFEHLHAILDFGYNFEDEAKDFNADFAIVKKDSLTKRKAVSSESEWIRLFEAWKAAVLVFYVHQDDELSSYKDYISKIFRACPNPSTAISLDRQARESYARQPYCMDDLQQLSFLMLSQLFAGSSSSSSPKRTAPSSSVPCK